MAAAGRLAGLTAIVTGASAGIAENAAKTFAREGARVAVVSRNVPEARRVAGEIEASGAPLMTIEADVTLAQDVERMVSQVMDRWGTVDILVNGVGGWHKLAPITDITEEDWDRIITLNLKSVFLCVRAVAKIMIRQKKGRIINLASQSGVGPNPGTNSNLPYAASKGALITLTKHLAKQLGPDGITVNCVSPGTTLTPRVRKVWDAPTIARKAASNPLRCLVDPQDSADAILFLASDESRHITGVNLNVNAGSAF
ncbi:MAG: SDR family NAD(P)-dependent oxidoreductase [Burkholderiales bacterium]